MNKLKALYNSITSKTLLALMVIAFVMGQASGLAQAAVNDTCAPDEGVYDCEAVTGNWGDWVPDVCGQNTNVGANTLPGSDNLQKAFIYLTSNTNFIKVALSPAGAAGVIGNLMVESGMDPTIIEGGSHGTTMTPGVGYGIAQWTTAARQQGLADRAAAEGKSVGDLGVQLDYLVEELEASYPGLLIQLESIGDAKAAADAFEQQYERALNGGDLALRESNAEKVLATYGAGSSTGGGISSGTGQQCGGGTGGPSAGSDFLGDPGVAAVLAANAGNNGDPPVAQCVGYVKYELGIHFPPYKGGLLGNGIDVASNLGKFFGVTVNTTPAVHAVFSMPVGLFGHTGFVSAINLNPDGSLNSFTVEEYNWIPGAYDRRTLPASYITQNGLTFAHTEVKWK